MKTKTVRGTTVEIFGQCGCNLVLVKVANCDNYAQANAKDLLRPAGELPEELADLKFHDPNETTVEAEKPVEEPAEPVA